MQQTVHVITPEEARKERARRIADAEAAIKPSDYNDALEGYLKEVRSARGYTDREPSEYHDSGVPRWAQDARDWVAFRDRVMLYGLRILNEYERTGVAPCTLDEFHKGLREIKIEWTYNTEEQQ